MQNHIYYIAFGSNLGDKEKNFSLACQWIDKIPSTRILKKSSLYLTEPLTKKNDVQDWYLNACLELESSQSPENLFAELKKIELSLGRTQSEKWAPRIVDLDILFWDNKVFSSATLCIPHVEINKRRFVLMPLADIAPQYIHPVDKKTIQELLDDCTDTLLIKVQA